MILLAELFYRCGLEANCLQRSDHAYPTKGQRQKDHVHSNKMLTQFRELRSSCLNKSNAVSQTDSIAFLTLLAILHTKPARLLDPVP